MTSSIDLDWQKNGTQENGIENNQSEVISATFNSNQRELIHLAIKNTVDKAISILADNIVDNSRYFLCEWQPQTASLTIVVTDDTKKFDAKYSVKCTLASVDKNTDELTDDIRHWIHNYLTTHAGFMQYSLIAIFHSNSRNKTVLL